MANPVVVAAAAAFFVVGGGASSQDRRKEMAFSEYESLLNERDIAAKEAEAERMRLEAEAARLAAEKAQRACVSAAFSPLCRLFFCFFRAIALPSFLRIGFINCICMQRDMIIRKHICLLTYM